MNVESILLELDQIADSTRLDHMKRFGINTEHALGVSIYDLRRVAKKIPKNHDVSLILWKTGIHEARILACYTDEIDKVTESQLESWVKDFNSWDLCDQCCSNLFDKTPHAYQKAIEWSKRTEEFVKRAGFVLMASLSIHDKYAKDKEFEPFFTRILEECTDDRVYVKKAVNWALRQIGKRNNILHKNAIDIAYKITQHNSKAAQWIAKDALRELTSDKIQKRVSKK